MSATRRRCLREPPGDPGHLAPGDGNTRSVGTTLLWERAPPCGIGAERCRWITAGLSERPTRHLRCSTVFAGETSESMPSPCSPPGCTCYRGVPGRGGDRCDGGKRASPRKLGRWASPTDLQAYWSEPAPGHRYQADGCWRPCPLNKFVPVIVYSSVRVSRPRRRCPRGRGCARRVGVTGESIPVERDIGDPVRSGWSMPGLPSTCESPPRPPRAPTPDRAPGV